MKLFFAVIFLTGSLHLYSQSVRGTVLDTSNGESLPSVSIVYNSAESLGTATDISGNFIINDYKRITKLEISFIGYQTKVIPREEIPPNGELLKVYLTPVNTELQEVTIEAGENPALRIVRNAIEAKKHNNPAKYDTYTFKSYSKNILSRKDSSRTGLQQMREMQQKNSDNGRYLIVAEAVSKNKYKAPDLRDEVITGSRISGFEEAIYALSTDNIQPFGLYAESIYMLTEYYTTPLATNADKKYAFILKDTIVKDRDTTYIMDYFPARGSNFEGLKGEIHINTNGWGMEYVLAEPYYKTITSFVIEHYYKRYDDKYWFSERLNAVIDFERLPIYREPGILYNQIFIDSVNINIPLSDNEFDHIIQELDDDAPFVDDAFWEKNRRDSLTLNEIKTYSHMDSIGRRYKFDFLMGASRNIYRGYITVGKLEYKATRFLSYNGHEGLRLGAGIYTNDRFSKKVRVGGYFGYGTGDKVWKYGGTLEYFLNHKKDNKISLNYFNDLAQPGRVTPQYYYNTNFWYEFFIQQMDARKEWSVALKTRLSNYLTSEISLIDYTISTNSNYRFQTLNDQDIPMSINQYRFNEAKLNLRWAYKERVSSNLGQQVSLGTRYPVFLMSYARGFENVLQGDFTYNKLEFGMWYYKFIRNWGLLNLRLEAGYVDEVIPLQNLFNQRGTNSAAFVLISRNTFQTMLFGEFFSDRYVSFFFNQNFGPILLRWGNFKPDIEVYHAMSFGGIRAPERHLNYSFKTMEKGYYESGLAIPNLINIKLLKLGYLGLGAGAFYRYGPYQLPNAADNWVFKGGFTFSVN